MNYRALVSFGVGDEFAAMLDVALPSFEAFAERHGYDLLIPATVPDDRPPSWQKIPLLTEALDDYAEVLWVDADAVIIDDADDVDVPARYWQALVAHRTFDGEVPGAGFWFLRRPMLPVLERMWGMTQYLHHGWWEQAALADSMGYAGHPLGNGGSPLHYEHATELYARTCFLDNGWSVHCRDSTPVERPRVMQATQWPDRLAVMREWAMQRQPAASAATN
jgi:galactosyl transferase GMA12/MNN10 family